MHSRLDTDDCGSFVGSDSCEDGVVNRGWRLQRRRRREADRQLGGCQRRGHPSPVLGPIARRKSRSSPEPNGVVHMRKSGSHRVLREIPAGSLPGFKRSRLGIIARRYDFINIIRFFKNFIHARFITETYMYYCIIYRCILVYIYIYI